jgi:hypothetical protein
LSLKIPHKNELPAGTIEAALARLQPPPNPYSSDPVLWVTHKLRRFLWSKQKEILEAIRDYRMVAVQSCHGPGKSFTASCAGAWWLESHPLTQAFLVTTAPSWSQVEAILWRELRRRHNEGNLMGRITLDCQWHAGLPGTRRADKSEELIAIGRKPADYDEDTFQGIHARYFMAILDEACGIPESLWNSVLSLATNENSRILAIGNPDDPNSRFASICKPGSGWHVIKISVWDTPNFTGEEVPQEVAEGLVSQLWVDDRRKDWGEGSPIWTAKVDGEFPDVSDEYLISPALIEQCFQLELSGFADGRYGMDVARMGADKSVVYRNRGGQVRLIDVWGKTDTMQSAGRMARILQRTPTKRLPANIDIIGVGAGVYDRLREQGYNVAAYQGSQRAINPAKFKNRRSEVWWTFRELMEGNLIDLDPKDEKLAAELGSIKWGIDSAGRIYVETKEDMIDRGLPSPNHADAAIMSTVAAANIPIRESDMHASITGDLMDKVM